MKKILWVTLSLLMVVTLVLSSCQTATVEEEKETETVTGTVTEKEATTVAEEEQEEAVVEEEKREMVTDPATGELVDKPRYGGTLNRAGGGTPSDADWDPWYDLDGGEWNQMGIVFDTLMFGDWSTPRSEYPFLMSYVPPEYLTGKALESYENPDPLTYVLHLRQGMRFWNKPPVNGREVTADDLKYSIDRNLGFGEFEEAGPCAHATYSGGWDHLESVEVIDKYTCVFHMKEPAPTFPEMWGMERMPFIIPREVVDTYGDQFTWEQVVGSGPWMIVDVVPDSISLYEKFPNYYGRDEKFPENQIPYMDTMKCLAIPDWSTRMAALRTGKIDLLGVGLDDALILMEDSPQLKYTHKPDVCYAALVRTDLEPYSDIRVRKAMQMAINLEEMNEAFNFGRGNPYPMTVNSAFPSVFTPLEELPEDCQEAFTYNPEKAKALLAEAGYPNGFKQVVPRDGDWEFVDALIAYWEAIGIETEINMMEGAVMWSYIYERNHELMFLYTCATWMPIAKLDQLWGGMDRISFNFSMADDPVFADMMKAATGEADAVERTRLVKEANAYATCGFWEIKGPERVNYYFWNPWLKSYNGEMTLTAWNYNDKYSRIWIDRDLKYEMTGTRD